MKIEIHGVRTLSEEVIIKIVPTLCPSDEEIISDAEQFYQIIRSYLPLRTYAILRDMLTENESE